MESNEDCITTPLDTNHHRYTQGTDNLDRVSVHLRPSLALTFGYCSVPDTTLPLPSALHSTKLEPSIALLLIYLFTPTINLRTRSLLLLLSMVML